MRTNANRSLLRDRGLCLELKDRMIRFASSLMARCSSKDRPKLPTEKERSKLQTEKERPQAPAFQEHSFKSVPNEWE